MKRFVVAGIIYLLATHVFSQEVAKEEIGNTKYLSDEVIDPQLEEQRLERQNELLSAPELLMPGKRHTYSGEHLEAIEFPIGAFGGGHVILDGTGNLKHWKIFNNGELSFIPNSFFAVKVKNGNNKPVSRVLQTNSVGPFEAMTDLEFQGEYPFAWLKFVDEELPVEISMEAYNPFIPMDLKNSAIPCAIFKLTAHNPTDKKVDVSFLYSQQNAVGYRTINLHGGKNSSREFFKNDTEFIDLNVVKGNSFEGYGQNVNEVYKGKGHTYVHLSSFKKDTLSGQGDMVIGTIGETAEATADWENLNKLHNVFTHSQLTKVKKTEPSKDAETRSAALAKSFTLKAGESRTVTFYLAWHFPYGDRGSYAKNTWGRGKWGGYGNKYANWWNNAIDVSEYLQDNYKKLEAQTKLYHASFYKTNFPYWLKDRITAQTSIMKTNTMFWDKNGYIGGWEGISPIDGACSGNCTHVWHYAQSNARLFPEMGRKMREQSFSFMKDDGLIPYRHPNGHEAFDGQCGEVLQAYREHLLSTDFTWLNANYPLVEKAMNFIIKTWDADRDGVLEGAKHNTLDSQLGGNSAWHGSLYAAALEATTQMALLQNRKEYANELDSIRKKAIDSHLKSLWNGEYFIQIADSVPRADFLTGCATDQLLGQWWANQLSLGKLYPVEIERTTLASVFKYNFKANFIGLKQNPREFVKTDEAGMLMITWPKGGRPHPHTSYADEVMSGFEYAAAATMIGSGLLTEGLTIAKAVSDRYTGELKVGYDGAWGNFGYSGNPFGDDECGKFYSRAMSNWSILLALQGFSYDGPHKMIGFNPVWQPNNHVSFFTASEAWGNYIQKREARCQVSLLKIDYGTLELEKFTVGIKSENVSKVLLTVNEQTLEVTSKVAEGRISVTFDPTRLEAGDSLTLKIEFEKETVTPLPGTLDRPGPAGWSNGGVWMDQHNDICNIGKKRDVDLVFIGNSITQSWSNNDRHVWSVGQDTWDQYYMARNAANFGISGDKVENILWRIENGNFKYCSPKVVVLMAGTNNLKESSSDFIIEGINAIIKRLQQLSPDSKLIVMGLLPRGQHANATYRQKIIEINKEIQKFDNGKSVIYIDLSSQFLDDKGTVKSELYRTDYVHLTPNGYRIWAETLEPLFKRLLY